MERVILEELITGGYISIFKQYSVEDNNNNPYVTDGNAQILTIESIDAGGMIQIIYKVFKIWGLDVVRTMDLPKIITIDGNTRMDIKHQPWYTIYKEDVLWANKICNFWSVITINGFKMYKYNENTKVLDRLVLLLLMDPFKFFSIMDKEINESLKETQELFQIIKDAIRSDLIKYLCWGEVKNMMELNSDIVGVIISMWIKSVIKEDY